MQQPYLGDVRMFGGNFAPIQWAFCAAGLLSIAQNTALYSLLGTTFGGDGRTTFALPNFQARLPLHQGNGFTLGERGGEVAHTLTINEMPAHNHPGQGNGTQNGVSPNNTVWAPADGTLQYFPTPNTTMNQNAISNTGGSQPHNNESPYLVLNFIIALQGIFPSQN